jgi:para-aminobenzoate synthetase/4-amino-4-deoxychorismate lyase
VREPAPVCLVHDASARRWLWFRDPVAVVSARAPAEVVPALAEVEAAVEGRGLLAAGFLAYEAAPALDQALQVRAGGAAPLLWFALFRGAETVPAPDEPEGGALDTVALAWRPSVSPARYRAALARIRRHIGDGETYQVNYTYRLRAALAGDPRALFAGMIRAQGPGYAAYLDTGALAVCSASPELFLARVGEQVLSRPMKGTRGRAPTPERDALRARELAGAVKDRAENIMIVDMVRNDLGRVAQTGTVRVPRLLAVERYPTVWQMSSDVRCETRATTAELLAASFPPASVTGAPKPRTMAIIAALEDSPRQVYTGCAGFLAPGRRVQLNVAIRTAVVDRAAGLAEYGVGGGIVWDSRAGDELEETRAKARIVLEPRPRFSLVETLRWRPGQGYLLRERHLARLARTAAYFDFPLDARAIVTALDALEGQLGTQDQRVRLQLSERGEIGVQARPIDAAEEGGPRPVRVALAAEPVDPDDPFLYHKTTRRETYERARASRPGCDDVLLWNRRGELTESCIANLVVVLDARRYTPPVDCGLLAGTYRGWLLEQGLVEERVIRVEDLAHAERVLLVSSVRGEREALVQPDCR